MKRIKWAEILNDAGVNHKSKFDKEWRHTASSNGDSITIITTSERVHMYLGQLKQLDEGRYAIFNALKKKAEKFGGMIKVYNDQNEIITVTVCTNGQLAIN